MNYSIVDNSSERSSEFTLLALYFTHLIAPKLPVLLKKHVEESRGTFWI